jgi:hypothetical protein
MTSSSDERHALRRLYTLLEREAELHLCNGCDGCGNRCVDGVELTRSEFEVLLAHLRTLPEEEVHRVLTQPKRRRWGEEAWVDLCPFRDEERGRCLVYPVRPFICRLFGHVEWMPCPLGAIPTCPPRSKEWLWAYVRWERRTIREWLTILPEADWLRSYLESGEG